MHLPRWTVYPALAVIGGFLVAALPHKSDTDPYAGAAAAVAGASEGALVRTRETAHKEVVVLGIDGMDPDILAEVVAQFPDRMPNFRWLIGQADGIRSLGTSCPPQSPVAWSNFITGLDPGGHGIFDFIHRDPVTRKVAPSTSKVGEGSALSLWSDWIIPLGGDGGSNRTGESFWSRLRRRGIPADIWRMPANFPVEPSKGVSFPGMMTPTLDSAYGECSFYTTDPLKKAELTYHKVEIVTERNGRIDFSISGPDNVFKEPGHGDHHARAPITLLVDREARAAIIDTGDRKIVMGVGRWSGFVQLRFDLVPLGWFTSSVGPSISTSQYGICRFYLRSVDPEVELYVSPVNLDPTAPVAPVSEPVDASAELADSIGLYYTQGMAEDVNALKHRVLTDAEFMQQVELVYMERRRMLDYALDRYIRDGEGGLLFFYFSTVDLSSHMMWRHFDGAHPAHDAELAAQDSSAWSRRAGSTWKDSIYDIYMRMDPALGRIREKLGDDVTLIVMSDHGFAPFRREFSLNTWLYENGYLVLKPGKTKEQGSGTAQRFVFDGSVDWPKTRAYGIGFNGLYLNLAGRERDDEETDDDESGIVAPADAPALLREIKERLEAVVDEETGLRPILRCDLARDVYRGARLAEAPDILVGYNAGYGNSDASTTGRIPSNVLEDNTGGTFNGNHLMAPEVVSGLLLSNKKIREGHHALEDLTVEVLRQFGIDKPAELPGHPVLE